MLHKKLEACLAQITESIVYRVCFLYILLIEKKKKTCWNYLQREISLMISHAMFPEMVNLQATCIVVDYLSHLILSENPVIEPDFRNNMF